MGTALRSSKLLGLLIVICASIQLAASEDLISYQGSGDYYVGHKYAWQGTTDGKSAPELLISSVINQPWLVAVSKSKNIIYWTDNKGVIGSWNVTSRHPSFVYQYAVGNWDESKGPALTGIDLDELNNHLYFTVNRSIYLLDLSQTKPAATLIASYNNLVFNPRVSASRNSLFFCLQNNFREQGDLVQVSLSDPTTLTTLVHNTSTGSIVQQLFIDEATNTLYYNSPGTLTMRGVSLTPPYTQVFTSIYLGVNPTFFDFNPTLQTFVMNDLRFSTAYTWSLGPDQPSKIYSPSSGRVTGVKFFNDTHILVAYQYYGTYAVPIEGRLSLININNPNDTSVLLRNFGMGTSLIFDEKYCDFYFAANPKTYPVQYLDQVIFRKNINEDGASVYQKQHMPSSGSIWGISLDVNKRNLIVSRANTSRVSTINYFPIDQPNSIHIPIIDSRGRSVNSYVVDDKTGDIHYSFYDGDYYSIYRLDAASISQDWINNVGHLIIGGIDRVGGSYAIDSGKKIYFSNRDYPSNDVQVWKANYDGSGAQLLFTIKKTYSVREMKWDPSSNRLFILSTPNSTWHMISINSDGSSPIYTSLGYGSGSSRDLFFSLSPDPFAEWVYMNAVYYQPLRIKKDGSVTEILSSYVPISTMSTLSFDESTGDAFYGDVQCSIKKININNVNKADPRATPYETVWQGDYNNYDLSSFIHDKNNQKFWVLQKNNSVPYPYSNYTVGVVPVNGGPAKQLFNFAQNIHPPIAVDTNKGKMFAYNYYLKFAQPQSPAIVMMDLYNGSNLVKLKEFKYPQYSGVTVTAMTLDPRTGLLYYTLDTVNGKTTNLESYDPWTNTTKWLWQSAQLLNVRDIKINGTVVVMAATYANIHVYDLATGSTKALNVPATLISLDPKSSTLYLGGGVISSLDLTDTNGTQTIFLKTFTIDGLAFDFANKNAYLVPDTNGRVLTTPPVYYRADLDGKNKKMMQVQPAFNLAYNLPSFSFANGKFYTSRSAIDSFNLDGSGYTRIFQNTYVTGTVQFDDASQRVYWQEESRFYSCAVYSNKYADCTGMNLFPGLQNQIIFLAPGFALGNNGMVYFISSYYFIYSMDLNIGPSSFKVFVRDDRFYSVSSIAIDKSRSALFITAAGPNFSPSIYRVSIKDGTITTLYSNIVTRDGYSVPFQLLLTDLTHCK